MAIIGNLNTKVSTTSTVSKTPINFGHIPEGIYKAVVSRVFPWKEIKKDTTMNARDENFKLIKDANNKYVPVTIKDAIWYTSDVIFTMSGGDYDGVSAKLFLSTHPDYHASKIQFLIRTGIYDALVKDGALALDDLSKVAYGAEAHVFIKNKTISVKNKDTGDMEDKEISYVSYVVDPKDVETPKDVVTSNDSEDVPGLN